MSKSGLMLDVDGAEQARRLLEQVALLVRVLRATHEREGVGAIDCDVRVADSFRRDSGPVAYRLDLPRDPLDGILPRDVYPFIAAGRAVPRHLQALRGGMRREHRHALDAE
jgi:hypothetical protein